MPIDVQWVVFAREAGDVVAVTLWREGSGIEMEIALEVVPIEE